ncbi:MAG: TetR/AcrR family transcriptional regulator [Pseudomonadales bacterium]
MSEKRQQLVETAFKLFYRKGVHAVGINEILAETGIAKKTLYHHFSSKSELISAVVTYRDECFCCWIEGELNKAKPGMARIDALFDALDDWFNDRAVALLPFRGCFFINVSGEYSNLEDPVHQQCLRHKDKIATLIKAQVSTLNIQADQIQRLTDSLCLLKEGAIVLAHVQGDRSAAQKAKLTAEILVKAYK